MKRFLLCVFCVLALCANTSSASAAAIYQVDRKDLSVNAGLDKNVQNILMLLQDQQSGASTSAMLLASINKSTGRAVMVSLVPDVLVDMPLAGEQPLCDAYMLGGVNLAMKTVNEIYGMNVQQFAVIDVGSFGDIVDILDGMHIALNEEEAAALGLEAGDQTLNAEQTMQYMRMDSTDPSVSRPYKCIMQLLYQATRDKDPGKLMSLGGKLLGALEETNLGVFDLIGLATPVMGSKEEREELMIPAPQTLTPLEWNSRALYQMDTQAAKQLLHETIYQ